MSLDIIYGHFLSHPSQMPTLADPARSVAVLKTEGKGPGVNLAVHLVNDSWLNAFDAAFVLSNDSDLAMAMNIVRGQGRRVGLIVPGDATPAAVQLAKVARPILRLRSGLMALAQLPDPIPGTTISKPKTG